MMWLLAQYLMVLSFNFNSDHYTHSEFSRFRPLILSLNLIRLLAKDNRPSHQVKVRTPGRRLLSTHPNCHPSYITDS
jgi:hypothetical protein